MRGLPVSDQQQAQQGQPLSPSAVAPSQGQQSQPVQPSMPPIEIVEGHEPAQENKRLVALFDEMEGKQLELIDEAGKSIIERISTLLAVLFAVTAFSNNFPPPYLKGNQTAKELVIATLLLYLLALGMGILATQPRKYQRYQYRLDKMRTELDRMIAYKIRWLSASRWFFAAGSVALAALIITIIWAL
jgi:hypothetical protein